MIYLPIAEMPVSVLLVLLVSGAVGFISGLVGVGGGFIMTPSLMFLGIPAPVAVATGASQIAATSFSGIMTQTRRKAVDWRMGMLLSIGGLRAVRRALLFERCCGLGSSISHRAASRAAGGGPLAEGLAAARAAIALW